jgi:Sulfate permease family
VRVLDIQLALIASWWHLELLTWQVLSSLAPCQLLAPSRGTATVSHASSFDFKCVRTRSRINGDVGGRTQMTSLVCSGIILLATFFLLPWLYSLPKCVLASMFVGLVHD